MWVEELPSQSFIICQWTRIPRFFKPNARSIEEITCLGDWERQSLPNTDQGPNINPRYYRLNSESPKDLATKQESGTNRCLVAQHINQKDPGPRIFTLAKGKIRLPPNRHNSESPENQGPPSRSPEQTHTWWPYINQKKPGSRIFTLARGKIQLPHTAIAGTQSSYPRPSWTNARSGSVLIWILRWGCEATAPKFSCWLVFCFLYFLVILLLEKIWRNIFFGEAPGQTENFWYENNVVTACDKLILVHVHYYVHPRRNMASKSRSFNP